MENHRISSERAKGTKRVEGAFCEFLSRISFSYFSYFSLPSPTNTCCTRHRGREIDFAAPISGDIRGSSCDFPFSPRIAFVSTKSSPSRRPFNPLRKPNHDPAFSALSMPSWPPINSGEIASLEAGQPRDNPLCSG